MENQVVKFLKQIKDTQDSFDNDILNYLERQEIPFTHIKFPARDPRDSYDYFKLFKYFGGVHFNYSELNISYLDEFRKEDKKRNVKFFFPGLYFPELLES